MKVSILLPYKENFSPEYPGAVSLFVYETSKISKYRKLITVFGNTDYKKKFNHFHKACKKIFLINKNYISQVKCKTEELLNQFIEYYIRLLFYNCIKITNLV